MNLDTILPKDGPAIEEVKKYYYNYSFKLNSSMTSNLEIKIF